MKEAIILCGGQGSRLKSSVQDRQKCVAEINGRPFLWLICDYLKSYDVEHLVLCTGYKSDTVRTVADELKRDFRIDVSREEEPLGTGGAVKNAKEFMQSENFFVLNGDSYCPVNLNDAFDMHLQKKTVATIALTKMAKNEDCGNVTIDDNMKLKTFAEKTSLDSPYVNTGIYLFNREVFDEFPETEKFSLEKSLFPSLISKGISGYVSSVKLIDIGTPERFANAQNIL